MRVGVVTELKADEYRAALTPAGASELVERGHDVLVETGAGAGSAFSDGAYAAVGAHLCSADEVWGGLRAPAESQGAVARGVRAATRRHHRIHVPAPGCGRGPDTDAHRERGDVHRSRDRRGPHSRRPCSEARDSRNARQDEAGRGARRRRDRPGGCFETSRPTTHSDPVYAVDGILHYCVANMPGAVPITSTISLTNVTLPYVEAIADRGVREAVAQSKALARGVNVVAGKLTHPAVAEAHGLPYTPLEDVFPIAQAY